MTFRDPNGHRLARKRKRPGLRAVGSDRKRREVYPVESAGYDPAYFKSANSAGCGGANITRDTRARGVLASASRRVHLHPPGAGDVLRNPLMALVGARHPDRDVRQPRWPMGILECTRDPGMGTLPRLQSVLAARRHRLAIPAEPAVAQSWRARPGAPRVATLAAFAVDADLFCGAFGVALPALPRPHVFPDSIVRRDASAFSLFRRGRKHGHGFRLRQ